MSNWEARELTVRQVHYGALDALLCGHVFRGLRLWHASPSACPSCRKMLGVMRDQVCGDSLGQVSRRSSRCVQRVGRVACRRPGSI